MLISGRIVIYVVGRSREAGGKLVVPALVLIHAFLFVYGGWEIVNETSNLQAGFARGFMLVIATMLTPFTILLQIFAQHREMRKMQNFGALSFPSFCMQAAVMAMIAPRHFVKLGTLYPGWVDDAGGNIFSRCLLNLLGAYTWFFAPVSYFIRTGGAVLVYFLTGTGRMGTARKNVELGVYHD